MHLLFLENEFRAILNSIRVSILVICNMKTCMDAFDAVSISLSKSRLIVGL